MEMLKAPKKSISLPKSKCPLIKTIDCIKQSLGAVEVDGSYSMPPQLLRTGCFQGLILTSWSSLNIIKPEFISTANVSVIGPDANGLDLSLSRALILLKCHHFGISRFNREI